jgi:hypothetical protein
MSIVSNFAYDVFISYAHLNNLKLAPEDEGWVTDLNKTIRMKLWEGLQAEPRIWFDQRGLDGRVIDEGIQQALHQSAVLLVVVSGAYLASDYCHAELKEFLGYPHPAFSLSVRGFKRVVVVVYDDESRAKWPPDLLDAPTTIFFESDAATGSQIRYNKPRRSDPAPYWDSIDKLTRHLSAVLREMQRGPGTGAGPEVAQAKGSPTNLLPVYLSEATDDLQGEREAVRQVLARGSQKCSVAVEPARSILNALSVRGACREGLARSKSSVHLINTTAGRIWGDADKPLAQMELEEALADADKPRPIVWMPPGLKLESMSDPGFRSFLQQVKAGSLQLAGDADGIARMRTPEVFELKLDDFLSQLDLRLFPAPRAAAWRDRWKQPGASLVYISHKAVDPNQLPLLIDIFRQRQCAVTQLDHGGTDDVQKRHETNLRFCDGMVIAYGRDGLNWAESLSQEAWILARQQHRPKRLGVFSAAGGEFGFIDEFVLPLRQNPLGSIDGIDQFVASLQEGTA